MTEQEKIGLHYAELIGLHCAESIKSCFDAATEIASARARMEGPAFWGRHAEIYEALVMAYAKLSAASDSVTVALRVLEQGDRRAA